jgi:hypothetical protein
LAGGNSKYVCIYEVSQRILLKKFQISYNRSLDGVLDEVCTVTILGRLDVWYERNDEDFPINIRSKALTGTHQWSLKLPWMSERSLTWSLLRLSCFLHLIHSFAVAFQESY